MNCLTNNKILHLGSAGNFVSSHYRMIEKHFNLKEHQFYLLNGMASSEIVNKEGVKIYKLGVLSILDYLSIAIRMCFARKIVTHGLNDPRLIVLLWLLPFLPKKVIWVLWGADLYQFLDRKDNIKKKLIEYLRRLVLKKIDIITTTIPGDYELARKWYDVSGKYVENIIYESHVARVPQSDSRNKKTVIKIQLGNSATYSNQHFEIIDKLAKLECDYIVYAPLSYGDAGCKEAVIDYGQKKLAQKFVPMTDFMAFNEYNKYMETIDVAIFNHTRQQAMGNIIAMLSLGKTVYLNRIATPFKYFLEKNFIVRDVAELPLIDLLTNEEAEENKRNARLIFSEQSLVKSWREIYEG